MAELFVKHTLNPQKVAKFNLNLKDYVIKGAEGDYKWLLEIGTTTLTASGTKIPPHYIHNVTEDKLETEIELAIGAMCSLMDWSDFVEDKYAPKIVSFYPQGLGIPIKANVVFKVEDESPASGIDLSELSVVFNNGTVDFDITSEVTITGDPFEYVMTWKSPNINR